MPRPANYISRSDLGWSRTSPTSLADPKSGLVVHYDSADQNLADRGLEASIAYWQRTRNFHTGPQRGWGDVGYSFMAAATGHILEGRGLYRAQAAQPGGNTTHYSVTLATGPNDRITAAQINAVRELRQWLMEPATSIAGTVLGHRDFIATSCPGTRAYELIRTGTFTQPPSPLEEDDVPQHSRFEKNSRQTLQPRTWASLRFDERHDGKAGDLFSLLGVEEKNGALYDVSVGVTLEGLVTGTEVQIRATEYEPDGAGGWRVARNRPLDSPVHAVGNGHFTYSWKGNLGAGRRLRIRLAQFGEAEAAITRATAEVFAWPR
ncbi:peptidoglycan recognition family protein [Nocardiopsis sp. SBT366]|uniref:peptidoglycan recognition protein family protein n=1 Tax=Nocardiopsis sp. SBT366 TaxID=1580529 RepID=UPI00066D5BFB|nr:peptidoglycan recognition family protein [Nocardiopsis sp. SBT366]